MTQHKITTVAFPSHWATALVNGDYSGLDAGESARCSAAEDKLVSHGWHVVSAVEDSERFTWSYALYDPDSGAAGGEVMDYVITRIAP